MRKTWTLIITAIIIFVLMVFSLNKNLQDSIMLVSSIGVFIIILLSYFYFEKSKLGTKEIAIIATLSAFAAMSRLVFAAIPNVKPVTFLVALSGFVFGPYEGFLIGSTSAFLSNIFFGQGPWTPWQMFSWGVIGAIAGFWGRKNSKVTTLKFSIACFLFGFMFDWIMNIWHLIGFVKPITLNSILLTYLTSLTFDILHGASSFIFSIIFYESFLQVLQRFKRKLQVTYIK
jgi:energy-coupling factor transport system substrate-specific component